MRCPFCQSDETKVLETRLVADGAQVRRRRECSACNERYLTRETVDLNLPRLIKRDGARESFDEDKLRYGLLKALEKRPINATQIETSVHNIMRKLRTQSEHEVSSNKIGEWVMTELKALDEVAYIRFASVYRQFQDIEAFREEIDKLMK
ncbi:transcriptional regulator NrdR [thiotrophic endosymbiont of Bathymodiolus puteoserpentis (Logatchev)]|uniref:transcriptional regulator NrdR n=1 Tax=thiotrophic endosymbiont of Bathymodiolus puteoserpentis (Logatchev) TaxID=343240 RepID=UPI0010BC31E3|nr:transcriptional regulator NrdR [thiotrophic endosymbiont of Bathymodiolus puteoserpentis (Logatchev)]CAC9588230.1 Ribonucleotide reductase transcriptional regulator NrdR [uncultured Gammaproteobacteria bacterium]CAC9636975.1 Ribonucleotide reductase transcriptional regulator NrdR [uncultured Gammaproteobacteria bacterium]SSC09912.1 Ribonucleotide reductase transcriptional regulator NrdR [thiotrophic endosymbiont of Bathymodiolus puteoserpentis (Logatchev)]